MSRRLYRLLLLMLPGWFREEFGREPRLVEPDLCVALGAALLAGTRAKTVGCLKLDPISAQSPLSTLTVTGRVLQGAEVPDLKRASVSLKAQDGSFNASKNTTAEGGFVFQDVPLAPEATTDFVLAVNAGPGKQVASHRFSVQQTATGGGGGLVGPNTNLLSKPIKIVCGAGAGGLPDLLARAYGEYLSQNLGQAVVVENKPGVGGALAAQAVKATPADGYTLLFAHSGTMIGNRVLYKNLAYDPD